MTVDSDAPASGRRAWAEYVWAGLVVSVLVMHVIRPQPGEDGPYWPWPMGLVPFPIAGALILVRRPGNGVGRVLRVVGVGAFLIFFTWWLTFVIYDSPMSPYVEVIGNPGVFLSFGGMAVLLHVFPTGLPIGAKHRRAVRAMWAILGLLVLMSLFEPAPLPNSDRPNPLAVDMGSTFEVVFAVAAVLLVLLVFAGFGILVARFRRGSLVERQQLRWFLAAAGLAMFTFFIFLNVTDWLDRLLGVTPGSIANHLIGIFLVVAMFWSLPAAITVAVLRYRLFEIDRLVSRTVTYVVVVAVLAGVFAAFIVGLQALLPAQSDLAVAGSTLAAAALFSPLRRRVQAIVDRRFNRSKYDAEAEVDALADRLRDAHDIDGITGEMLEVVTKTIQPVSVGVWMAGGGR